MKKIIVYISLSLVILTSFTSCHYQEQKKIDQYSREIVSSPDDSRLYQMRAVEYVTLYQKTREEHFFEKATNDYHKAISIEKDDYIKSNIVLELAEMFYYLKKDYRQSIRLLTGEVLITLQDPCAYYLAGISAFRIGDYISSETYLIGYFRNEEKSKKSCADKKIAVELLCGALFENKKYSKMVNFYEENGIKSDTADLIGQLGVASLYLHDYTRAIKYFEIAVNANPILTNAHLGLVWAYLGLGNIQKAKEHLLKAKELGLTDELINKHHELKQLNQ